MNKKTIFWLLILFLLVGCGVNTELISPTETEINTTSTLKILPTDTPKPSATITPTITPTITQTNTPTVTPTTIGGSTGPVLAISMGAIDGWDSYIIILDLFSEMELGRISIHKSGEALRLSPNCEKLAFIDTRDGQTGIYLYNLLTEEISLIYSQPDETGISYIRWSPDQNWLAFKMDNFSRRNTELWVVNLVNGAPQYVSVGYKIDWLSSGELIYQDSGGTYFKRNVLTGNASVLTRRRVSNSNLEALVGAKLSSYGISYSPEFETYIINASDSKNPESPIHTIIRRETDEAPGLYLTRFKTEAILSMWNLHLSPDGKYWLACFLEREEPYIAYGEGFSSGAYFTSWATHDELPLTSESMTAENFLPYLWAPDSSSILGFKYEPRKITNIQILDLKTGDVLFDYPLLLLGNLQPITNYDSQRPKTFDINWNVAQIDLSSKQYIPRPPAATSTIPPDVSFNQPMVDNIMDLEKKFDADLTMIHSTLWEFSNLKIQDDQSLMVTGTNNSRGFLGYKYELNDNQGVLVKYKYDMDSMGILALSRGPWETTTTHQNWGTLINGYGIPSLLLFGNVSLGQFEDTNELFFKNNNWYYIFMGINDNEMVQIIWDANYPIEYALAYHDYGDSKDLPFYFQLAVSSGQFFISEMTVYDFSGFIMP